jgi:hypothetical protein
MRLVARVAPAVLLAVMAVGSGAGAQTAGGPADAPGTAAPVGPVGGVKAAVGVRALAIDAFPRLRDRAAGVDPDCFCDDPRTPRPPPDRARKPSRITGWPRIPDLPQVKAKIAITNRIVSHAEAACNPTGTLLTRDEADILNRRPRVAPLPAKESPRPTPPRAQDPESERLIRDVREAHSVGAVRSLRRHAERMGPGEALGAGRPADPRLTAGEDGGTPTLLERADAHGRAHERTAAAAANLDHLDRNSDDAAAMRSLALTMLLAGRTASADEALLRAYAADPSLARRPIDRGVMPPGVTLRRLVTDAISRATRLDTPGAWLTAAVLVQGEGRREVAARLVERARRAGLEGFVADALVSALAER